MWSHVEIRPSIACLSLYGMCFEMVGAHPSAPASKFSFYWMQRLDMAIKCLQSGRLWNRDYFLLSSRRQSIYRWKADVKLELSESVSWQKGTRFTHSRLDTKEWHKRNAQPTSAALESILSYGVSVTVARAEVTSWILNTHWMTSLTCLFCYSLRSSDVKHIARLFAYVLSGELQTLYGSDCRAKLKCRNKVWL